MLDRMDLSAQSFVREGAAQFGFDGLGRANVSDTIPDQAGVRAMSQNEQEPAPVVDARFAVDRDVIQFTKAETAFSQAVFDRFGWQPGPMFDAPKAFFLRCGDEFTVANEARGRITVKGI